MSSNRWRPSGFIERVGTALLAPSQALDAAEEQATSEGKTGTDVAVLIGLGFVAVYTHVVVAATWLAIEESILNAFVVLLNALARSAANDLAFVFLAGIGLTLAAGSKRSFGRDLDLAFVAYVPIALVRLAAEFTLTLADTPLSETLATGIAVLAYGWAAGVLYLAWQTTRARSLETVPSPAADTTPSATTPEPTEAYIAAERTPIQRPPRSGIRVAGWLTLTLAVGLAGLNGYTLASDLNAVRPVSSGAEAPSFHLHAIDKDGHVGSEHVLSEELRGQVVLLDFWATWCGPCIDAMPDIAALDARFGEQGLMVVSINMDDAANARTVLNSLNIDLPLYADDGTTSKRYKVTTIPHLVLIDRDGMIRYVQRGKLGHSGLVDALEAEFPASRPPSQNF